ncbi:unnamed protein product [Cyprideis torosa]|uniref:Uncharacterized protein n=1 Tax=Cyprideis torosa TaxID=163714 RepID=A0A7R8WN31_9CRUS|nr:unnamed protein product [Cyprideis torosa]CAG0900132.1 unnamed protein product [Cyprideis torosa]
MSKYIIGSKDPEVSNHVDSTTNPSLFRPGDIQADFIAMLQDAIWKILDEQDEEDLQSLGNKKNRWEAEFREIIQKSGNVTPTMAAEPIKEITVMPPAPEVAAASVMPPVSEVAAGSVMPPAPEVASVGEQSDLEMGFEWTRAQKKRKAKALRKEFTKKVRTELDKGDYKLPPIRPRVKEDTAPIPTTVKAAAAASVPTAPVAGPSSSGTSLTRGNFAEMAKKGILTAERRMEIRLRRSLTTFVTRYGNEEGGLDEEDWKAIDNYLEDKLVEEILKNKKDKKIARVAVGRVSLKLKNGIVQIIVDGQPSTLRFDQKVHDMEEVESAEEDDETDREEDHEDTHENRADPLTDQAERRGDQQDHTMDSTDQAEDQGQDDPVDPVESELQMGRGNAKRNRNKNMEEEDDDYLLPTPHPWFCEELKGGGELISLFRIQSKQIRIKARNKKQTENFTKNKQAQEIQKSSLQ